MEITPPPSDEEVAAVLPSLNKLQRDLNRLRARLLPAGLSHGGDA